MTRVLREMETVVRRSSCAVEDRGTPTHLPPLNLTRHWGRWAEPVGGQAGMTDAAHPAGSVDGMSCSTDACFFLFCFLKTWSCHIKISHDAPWLSGCLVRLMLEDVASPLAILTLVDF